MEDEKSQIKVTCPLLGDPFPVALPDTDKEKNKMMTPKLIFTFMPWAALVGLVNCGAVFADQEEKPKNLTILQQ